MYSFISALRQNAAVVDAKIGEGYTWGDAFNVAMCGVVIVFLMLVLLVVVIVLFGKIMKNTNDIAKSTSPKVEIAPTPVVNNTDSTDEEVVAAIAAAVGYLYSGTGVKPVIRSIKRSDGRTVRSAWANAGIAQNTRAF